MTDKYFYLSVFDPGHVSSVWDMKGTAALLKKRNYQTELKRALSFNLLFRKTVIIRHIDLFNNVALMDFMGTADAQWLREAGCLKITVPSSTVTLQEHFNQWAFRGSSQHWHILTPKLQADYDKIDFSQLGDAQAREKLSDILRLKRLGIDLDLVFDGLSWWFKGENVVSPLRSARKTLFIQSLEILEPTGGRSEADRTPRCRTP